MIHPRLPSPIKGGQGGRFCTFCGRPLIERLVPDGFDARTGQPTYEKRRDCPLLVTA